MRKGQIFKLNQEQHNKLVDMISHGFRLKDIAKEFKVTHTTISNYIKKNNLQMTNTMTNFRYEFSKEQLEYVKSLAKQGAPIRIISSYLNVDRDVIKRIIKENDIVINNDKVFISTSLGKKEYREQKIQEGIHPITIGKEYNEILRNIALEAKKYAFKNEEKQKYNVNPLSSEAIEIIKKYINNKSISDIANMTNYSEEKISEYCKRNGISTTSGPRRIFPPDSNEFNDDIGNERLSHTDIARKYNVSAAVAKRWRIERFGKDFKTKINTWTHKSSSEIIFEEILIDLDLAYIFQKTILGWKIDFYLGHKIAIEINGSHWHDELEKVITKDKKKQQDLELAGFKYVVFWDYELEDKEKIKEQIIKILYGSICEEIHELNYVNASQSGVL